MKAIANTGPGQLELRDWPTPQPGPGEVRIRTSACGICATDLAMIAGWQRTGFPAIPGHEWSGVVDAVGEGVDGALAGEKCVAENVRADGGEVGFEHPGGYGQFLITEARNVHRLPADFPMDVAALIEPLAVSVRALTRLRLADRRSALVMGDGPIGLIATMLLKQAGVERIVMVGGRGERLAVAGDLGASATVNYHDLCGPLAGGIAARAGRDFPNVFEATGSAAAMEAAMDLAAVEGKVLVIGDYAQARAGFPWNQLLHRQLELIGSNASAGAWGQAVEIAVARRDPLGRLISHRIKASDFARGMQLMRGRSGGTIKVVMEW